MSQYSGMPVHNITRDWNKAQGMSHPTDGAYQIRRDVGLRYITVENSAPRPIGCAITTYSSGPTPPILFSLAPGEIKHLGINSQGGPPQFLWILDLTTKLPAGENVIIQSNSNQLVLRDGVNKWFVQFFSRPSYSAAK